MTSIFILFFLYEGTLLILLLCLDEKHVKLEELFLFDFKRYATTINNFHMSNKLYMHVKFPIFACRISSRH